MSAFALRSLFAVSSFVLALACGGCRDVARFDSNGDHYEGSVIAAEFVRTGVETGTTLCLTLDTNRLDDAPGTVSSSDGRFARTPLVPMPPVAHDPLSTLSFGTGRTRNLLFGAHAVTDAGEADVLVVVSLMDSGNVEVRLVKPGSPSVFAIFPLERRVGVCPFGPT